MFKKPLYLILYTLLVIVISSVITTGYIHYFVLNSGGAPAEVAIKAVSDEQVSNSPIKQDNVIVEIFSYGCHYCALNENNVAKLEARMPAGSKLQRVHVANPQNSGLASFAPLFATLTVMGIEPQHRESAYKAVIKDRINLADTAQLNQWLQQEGIDISQYKQVSQSEEVKELMSYMTAVSSHYKINATPTFIVGKKWQAIQDSDFPEFSDKLLSLLQHDKLLEK
ncbi:DsbA family protein [Serratia sp. NPDC078593]|uniref:DsbA family protein n=1 Tax=unclassified Serratia (in: enterobacteria) TaxID=2647522 RepID=UPI0037D2813A